MNTVCKSQAVVVDEHVFLVGRPPLGEFIGFVSSLAVQDQTADQGALAEEWRRANDYIQQLKEKEAGWSDAPEIIDPSPSLSGLCAKVYEDPIFRRSFSIVPSSVGFVELDRLVVYQKHINLEYVHKIQNDVGEALTEEAIFRTCLPFDHPQPPVTGLRISNNAYVFASPSTDLRFLEPTLLDSSQIVGYQPQGPVSGVIGLVVGFGSNFLNALFAEGRLILNNGSHRAYALRDLGVSHVPCIIQHISRRDELQVIGPRALNRSPDVFLKSPRPPVLKDYFDPKLRKVLSVPRRRRQVKITYAVEQIDVPAT